MQSDVSIAISYVPIYRVGQKYVYSNYFFTGIVNYGRELKYRTKKVDCEVVLEK